MKTFCEFLYIWGLFQKWVEVKVGLEATWSDLLTGFKFLFAY